MHGNWLGSAFCLAFPPWQPQASAQPTASAPPFPAQPTALYFLLNACTVMPVCIFPYVLGSRQ